VKEDKIKALGIYKSLLLVIEETCKIETIKKRKKQQGKAKAKGLQSDI